MYNYQAVKPRLFSEDGSVLFVNMRDDVKRLLKEAGAFRMQEVMHRSGDTWTMLACVDRMVELGEIREITGPDVAGQHRVFVATQ